MSVQSWQSAEHQARDLIAQASNGNGRHHQHLAHLAELAVQLACALAVADSAVDAANGDRAGSPPSPSSSSSVAAHSSGRMLLTDAGWAFLVGDDGE